MAMYRTFNSETTQIKIVKIFGGSYHQDKPAARSRPETQGIGINAMLPIPKPAPEFWKYPLDYRKLR